MMQEAFVSPGAKGAAIARLKAEKVATRGAGAAGCCCRSLAFGMCFVALIVAATMCYQLSVLTPHIVRLSNIAAAVQPAVPAIQAFSETVSPADATKIGELFHVMAKFKSSADGMQQLLVAGSLPQLATHILHENFGEIASQASKALASVTNALLAASKVTRKPSNNENRPNVNRTTSHRRPTRKDQGGSDSGSGSGSGSGTPTRAQSSTDPSNTTERGYYCYSQEECPHGEYCAIYGNASSRCEPCYMMSYNNFKCDALDHDCCSRGFLGQCGDITECSGPPQVLKDLAKITSFASSIVVKFAHLQQVGSKSGGMYGTYDTGSWSDDQDHGLLLQFMEHVQDLAIQQTNLAEWAAASDACIALVDQLMSIDYQGAYYCDETEVHCAYSYYNYDYNCNVTKNQECSWDANTDMKTGDQYDAYGGILPTIRQACVALSSVRSHEDTNPTDCTIMYEAACSQKKKLGLPECLQCVAEVHDPATLAHSCPSTASSAWCDPNGYGVMCLHELETLCADAKRSSAGNCFVCAGQHQAQLEAAHCVAADFDTYCADHPLW